MVKELLRTIPHALSGRSKFGRTLMYMSPVASSTIIDVLCQKPDFLYVLHQK